MDPEPFSYAQGPADVQEVAPVPGAESDADMQARAERARARIATQPDEMAPPATREEAIRRMKAEQASVWDINEAEAAQRARKP